MVRRQPYTPLRDLLRILPGLADRGGLLVGCAVPGGRRNRMSKGTSRLPGFYKMKIAERLRRLAEALDADADDLEGLGQSGTLPLLNADAMIENAVGVLGLP